LNTFAAEVNLLIIQKQKLGCAGTLSVA